MRNFLKQVLSAMAKSNICWIALEPVSKLVKFLEIKRRQIDPKPDSERVLIPHFFSSMEVLNGPFKGMKYPGYESVGSSLYPKLLGSYEKEIQDYIQDFCNKEYSTVIDIGSAEGYYAVGMSLRKPTAMIYAYDTDEKARKLCSEMALLNKVENKVVVKEFCSAEELAGFDLSEGSLIICDCEGYEKYLFNESNIDNLKFTDLIIETHDFIDIEISTYLESLFSKTHDITVLKSIDDIEKAKKYQFKETEKFNLTEKWGIFKEGRPAIMEWLICSPKVSQS